MAYDYDYDDLFGALALENGYWKPDGPYRKKRGQFGARRQQPTNRTNPAAAEAMRIHHEEGIPLKDAWARVNGVSTFGRTTAKHKKGTARYRKAHGLGGPGTGNADRIVFDTRGFVANPVTDFGALGTIDVKFVNKVARASGFEEDWTVKISRTGMTRIDTTPQAEYDGLRAGTSGSSSTP